MTIKRGVLTSEYLLPNTKYLSFKEAGSECSTSAQTNAQNRAEKYLLTIYDAFGSACGSRLKVTKIAIMVLNVFFTLVYIIGDR